MEKILELYREEEKRVKEISKMFDPEIKELQYQLNVLIRQEEVSKSKHLERMRGYKKSVMYEFIHSDEFDKLCYKARLKEKSRNYLMDLLRKYNNLVFENKYLEVNSLNIRHSKFISDVPLFKNVEGKYYLSLKTLKVKN